MVIARAQGVHVFQPLSTNNQGQIGELYVTNFKLSFQTIRFPEYRREHYMDQQGKSSLDRLIGWLIDLSTTAFLSLLTRLIRLLSSDFWHPCSKGLIDLPLASISGLYRVSKNGRRKSLKIGPLKKLVVVCKNFRLETFSFLQSSATDSHGVASALAGYVFPAEKELLFIFSQNGAGKGMWVTSSVLVCCSFISPSKILSGPCLCSLDATVYLNSPASFVEKESPKRPYHVLFSVRNDWSSELSRLKCLKNDWRICQANEDFHLCQKYKA